ncbi:glycosyltransferase family 8 protein [Acidaminococcus massiliensis]|uniref:glycosyltransferase family 8 protein n=1 Tax=Acidaminococcus massiliensis TaxID=1852375 RepID=UPI00266CCDDF|nr:glycosyltransferase family 8 protein [Acidaminococcus massiliensis]
MEKISIVLASDDNYAQHGAVACASILVNHKGELPIHFYYFDDGISEEKQAGIAATVTERKGSITFIPTVQREIQAHTSGHVNRAAYLRLLIPELVPGNVDRVIYLDTDLVVLDDIQELWDMDLGGKPLGAVPDLGILASSRMRRQKEETLGIKEGKLYFNSGVMVMDLKAWRENQYGPQVIRCVEEGNFRHHDQDGLNKVFQDNWQPLPLRWNVIPPVFTLPVKVLKKSRWRNLALEALERPAVFHWAGRYKPWEFAPKGHFNEKYYTYLAQTAFAGARMPQPGTDMRGKSVTRQELRLKLAELWKKLF